MNGCRTLDQRGAPKIENDHGTISFNQKKTVAADDVVLSVVGHNGHSSCVRSGRPKCPPPPVTTLEYLNPTLGPTLTDLDPNPNAKRNANPNPNPSDNPQSGKLQWRAGLPGTRPSSAPPPPPSPLFLSKMHKSSPFTSTCAEIRALGEQFRGEPFRPPTCWLIHQHAGVSKLEISGS